MATHKLAILVEAIGAAKASKQLAGVDKTISNIGGRAGQGLRTAGKNLVGIGAVAGAGIALAVKTGLDDLATLESAVTSVDGAIKQMGLTGQVTGTQIAGWANDIEASIGAAFDDKEITQATTTLLRFGKVTPANLRPAMVVMTDLAAKTGSVDSASTLLAKALADPTKAAGKLARQGIVLTKGQEKQIKAFVKAGKVGQAQALILDAVAKSTNGAAAASQGPYARAIKVLGDVSEDARKALAEGFLPVIEKVAGLLSTELAKPQTMANIREFGQGLAKGLDSLIEIARNLPWGTIGNSLKIAGEGGKAVLDAFSKMPDWVQTAILTGWGLNKLSGGALGDIVGELGKGLIKGVLGMNAGVVNITAGTVNGPGGPGGVPVGGPGGGGNPGGIVKPLTGAMVFLGPEDRATLDRNAKAFATAVHDNGVDNRSFIEKFLHPINPNRNPGGALTGGAPGRGGPNGAGSSPMKGWAEAQAAWVDNGKKITDLHHGAVEAIDASGKAAASATDRAKQDIGSKVTMGAQGVAQRVTSGTSGTTAATNVGSSRIVGAIAANRPIVTTTVKVYVTPAGVTKSTNTAESYGNTTGSGGSGSNGANKPG